MVLTETGLAKVLQRIKSFVISQLNSKASAIHTHSYSDITDLPNGYVVDSTLDGTSSNAIANSAVSNALDECVPKAGGAVMTGDLRPTRDNSGFSIGGGTDGTSGSIAIYGKGFSAYGLNGVVRFLPTSGARYNDMQLRPDGTWTWAGQAVQLISDQRLKQQIAKIDDKLLDAWEDVNLVQFKYNDAVDEKGKDKARLHTGYVVQQIDNACKSHGVDVSQYGLYCHEEYPQETEEVEVEQADGTKTKETKVIREASEHYSLRYTEVYAVECMYLRRENSRLKEKLASLEERLEKLEKAENQEK